MHHSIPSSQLSKTSQLFHLSPSTDSIPPSLTVSLLLISYCESESNSRWQISWVETNGGIWWPAQLVSENAVSGNNKPLKTSSDEVPVRIYGSYKFMYVVAQKCFSDFEMILKQNNGSHRDIFLNALEQTRIRTLPRLKKHGKKVDDKANGKPIKPDGLLKNGSIVGAELLTEAGARRLRVVRKLGLVSPPGSPYIKNGRS